MKTYFSKWNYKRLIQLGIGLYSIWEYFQDPLIFALLFGLLMIFQAILNIGCFSTRGCNSNIKEHEKENFSEHDELDFEEIK